jgi:uncharacterized membrane protein
MDNHYMSPARLEAFSDGVIAIIITIMVLDLRVPTDPRPVALLKMWPTFLSYFVSYLLVAIYWVNHHHLFHQSKTVNNRILWTNIVLLFCMSWVPFLTAYMGANRVNSFAVALYSAVLMLCGLSFLALRCAIAEQFKDDSQFEVTNRAAFRKNLIAVLLNCVAIPVAYLSPGVSLGIIFAIAFSYFVPNIWVS